MNRVVTARPGAQAGTVGRVSAERIAEETGTRFRFTPTVDLPPALCDPEIQEGVEASARALGLSTRRTPSGAGHDGQSFALIAPMGM